MDKITKKRRNTRIIGFNDAEYQEIIGPAKKAGLLPRQYVLLKVRRK